MLPLDLIQSARRQIGAPARGRVRQSDLKRALSTAYYAMFHMLCRNCADLLIGTSKVSRSQPAWRQVYRAVDHGFARTQCRNRAVMGRFPRPVEDFALLFSQLQEKRHAADYDPFARFTRQDVAWHIDAAESAIRQFGHVPVRDRRAFAAWTAMRSRSDQDVSAGRRDPPSSFHWAAEAAVAGS